MARPIREQHRKGDRRTVERTDLGRQGVLRIDGDMRAIEVTVLDLTREGCRVETSERLAEGTGIEIGIGNLGRMKASVMWSSEGSFGCAFDVPLPPGAITAALSPPNIVSFPADAQEPASRPFTNKFSPRTRLFLLLGVTAACWLAIGAVVLALV